MSNMDVGDMLENGVDTEESDEELSDDQLHLTCKYDSISIRTQ